MSHNEHLNRPKIMKIMENMLIHSVNRLAQKAAQEKYLNK